MIKHNIKQAWQLIKQNKVYSSVYILGTGLAISMTMVLAIVYYIKIAPIYPENNRNRTMVIKNMKLTYPDSHWMSTSNLSYPFVKEHLYTLETPEAVTAVLNINVPTVIKIAGEKGTLTPIVKYVDHNFWKVFTFNFLAGKPFTETDFESAIKTVVISASLANKLFGTIKAEGLYLNMNNNDYRIAGVVKDPSFATPITYGDIWVPYMVKPEELKPVQHAGNGYLGRMHTYILSSSVSDMQNISKEVTDVFDKINNSQSEYTLHLNNQPDPYWKSIFRISSNRDIDWMDVFKSIGVLILAMLFIPAINLAGMVSSRMEKRLPEMGIRKTFGASRRTLYNQILTENFLLTLMGGIFGLIISCTIIYLRKDTILTLLDKWPSIVPGNIDNFFTFNMLINPTVFFLTLLVCLILNFVSAIIPAWQGLKKNIVYSLNKDKV